MYFITTVLFKIFIYMYVYVCVCIFGKTRLVCFLVSFATSVICTYLCRNPWKGISIWTVLYVCFSFFVNDILSTSLSLIRRKLHLKSRVVYSCSLQTRPLEEDCAVHILWFLQT